MSVLGRLGSARTPHLTDLCWASGGDQDDRRRSLFLGGGARPIFAEKNLENPCFFIGFSVFSDINLIAAARPKPPQDKPDLTWNGKRRSF